MKNKDCVVYEKIDWFRKLNIHQNSPKCPLIYEIVPVIGCQFECEYCNALGQEEGKDFLPVQIDEGYLEYLEKEIKILNANNENPLYYYSPKTDCFQDVLLENNLTLEILRILNKYHCEYVLVSKGVPNDKVFAEMKKSGRKCQMIITYAMPTEEYRELLEKGAAPNSERYSFAKKCKENDIDAVVILEPILPLEDLGFVEEIMHEFLEIGINHFAIDFARISEACLDNIVRIIPEHKEYLHKIYHDADADKQTFKTAKGTYVMRTAPSKKYILEKFNEFKVVAKKYGATVSACNSFGFKNFNDEANEVGYECMGIRIKSTNSVRAQ